MGERASITDHVSFSRMKSIVPFAKTWQFLSLVERGLQCLGHLKPHLSGLLCLSPLPMFRQEFEYNEYCKKSLSGVHLRLSSAIVLL